jgi:hypothetical protein
MTVGGITEINYSPKLEAAYVRGAGSVPVGVTTGLASFSADMTLLLAEADQFQLSLGPSFMTAFFDVEVNYSDEGYTGAGFKVITDSIRKCRITEVSQALSNGNGDGLVRKYTLLPLELYMNGISPVPNQPSISLGGIAGTAVGAVRRLTGI